MTASNDWNYGEVWLRSNKRRVSPAGARCANFINWVFEGIYHVDDHVLRTDWAGEHWVKLNLWAKSGMSTYDGNILTRLVVGAHDFGIRLELRSASPQYVSLYMYPRDLRASDSFADRIPTMEAHLASIKYRHVLLLDDPPVPPDVTNEPPLPDEEPPHDV